MAPEHLLMRSAGFYGLGGIMGCVDALDGMHVEMSRPKKLRLPDGARQTHYYNYKGFHSMVVLTVVDDVVRPSS